MSSTNAHLCCRHCNTQVLVKDYRAHCITNHQLDAKNECEYCGQKRNNISNDHRYRCRRNTILLPLKCELCGKKNSHDHTYRCRKNAEKMELIKHNTELLEQIEILKNTLLKK